MRELAQALSGVQVAVLVMDLNEPDSGQQLFDKVIALGLEVDVLVNNAGLGFQKPLLGMPLDQQLGMVDVNDRALLALTRLFAEPMAERGGLILNVSSVSAWFPIPGWPRMRPARHLC